jgi:hypothetical protein
MLGCRVVRLDPGLDSRQARMRQRPVGDEAHSAWSVTVASLRRDDPVANSRNTALWTQRQHDQTDRCTRHRGCDRKAQSFPVVESGPLPLDECATSVRAVNGRDSRAFRDPGVGTRLRDARDVVKSPLTKARRSIAQLRRWIVKARHGVIVCGALLTVDRIPSRPYLPLGAGPSWYELGDVLG